MTTEESASMGSGRSNDGQFCGGSMMNLNRLLARAAIGCALGAAALGLTLGTANAEPPVCPPGMQCGPGGGPGAPGPGGGPGTGLGGPGPGGSPGFMPGGPGPRGPGGPGQVDPGGPGDFGPGGPGIDWRPPWNPGENDWRGRFHGAPWGDGLPPWGLGAPPRPASHGMLPPPWGPPPPPINYFGYTQQPVWDPAHNQWGFWFFGVWIPLPV
jgi:hypothetical protein